MKFKKFLKYYLLGESVKEQELNRILDKVSSRSSLSDREQNFLNLYQLNQDDDRDLMYLSKNTTYESIRKLMEGGKKVICDLYDRNGKIGLQIIGIDNDFENETCIVIMKGDERHELHDKFLYNIIYNNRKDEYSLQEQDEYFEKIPVNNEND